MARASAGRCGSAARRYLVAAVAISCAGLCLAGAKDHTYKVHDTVPLYANKVGPFHNPRCGLRSWQEHFRFHDVALVPQGLPTAAQAHEIDAPVSFSMSTRYLNARVVLNISFLAVCSETYQYYDLPFCPEDDGPTHKTEDLGEVSCETSARKELILAGSNSAFSPSKGAGGRPHDEHAVRGPFQSGQGEREALHQDARRSCFEEVQDRGEGRLLFPGTHVERTHSEAHLAVIDAAHRVFASQMYYDDLPIWGFIGKIEKILKPGSPELRYYLFTHVHFDIAYNGDRVVEINVSTDPLQTVRAALGIAAGVMFMHVMQWDIVARQDPQRASSGTDSFDCCVKRICSQVDITEGDSVPVVFSYSVKWKETSIPFERRMEKCASHRTPPRTRRDSHHADPWVHSVSVVCGCVLFAERAGSVSSVLTRDSRLQVLSLLFPAAAP